MYTVALEEWHTVALPLAGPSIHTPSSTPYSTSSASVVVHASSHAIPPRHCLSKVTAEKLVMVGGGMAGVVVDVVVVVDGEVGRVVLDGAVVAGVELPGRVVGGGTTGGTAGGLVGLPSTGSPGSGMVVGMPGGAVVPPSTTNPPSVLVVAPMAVEVDDDPLPSDVEPLDPEVGGKVATSVVPPLTVRAPLSNTAMATITMATAATARILGVLGPVGPRRSVVWSVVMPASAGSGPVLPTPFGVGIGVAP